VIPFYGQDFSKIENCMEERDCSVWWQLYEPKTFSRLGGRIQREQKVKATVDTPNAPSGLSITSAYIGQSIGAIKGTKLTELCLKWTSAVNRRSTGMVYESADTILRDLKFSQSVT
jgi:hypothetical protein